jgi:hypothetical protein
MFRFREILALAPSFFCSSRLRQISILYPCPKQYLQFQYDVVSLYVGLLVDLKINSRHVSFRKLINKDNARHSLEGHLYIVLFSSL